MGRARRTPNLSTLPWIHKFNFIGGLLKRLDRRRFGELGNMPGLFGTLGTVSPCGTLALCGTIAICGSTLAGRGTLVDILSGTVSLTICGAPGKGSSSLAPDVVATGACVPSLSSGRRTLIWSWCLLQSRPSGSLTPKDTGPNCCSSTPFIHLGLPWKLTTQTESPV